jgi:sigma-B regulation protein RsbU (phosphoserine phosphatase)
LAPSATPESGNPATAAFYSALAEDDPAELYDNAPCAYLSMLPDGTVIKVNATFLTWTGYGQDAVFGRRFQDLLAPGDRIFYETHAAPLLLMQGSLREIAVAVTCPAGERLPVLLNAILKRDEAGQPLVIRAVMFDATERLAYERELLAAKHRAEESEARARVLAQTLQRSFLPPAIITVPGLDLGGAYRPAGDGSEVGGDFYDVFHLGPPDACGIVLGDVCGKGAGAAVVTALARYTVRAEALHVTTPSGILTGLHQALVAYYPDTFCTALFGLLEPVPGGHRLTAATGGHPLPLCRRADGSVETIGHPGSFLGMRKTARLNQFTAALSPGDTMILYTDGVTEGRRDEEFFGESGVAGVLGTAAAAGQTAQQIADSVVAAAVGFQDGVTRDDIAVVVVREPT